MQTITQAREIAAGISGSPALSKIWDRHHVTRQDENPSADLAAQIRNIEDNIEDHPELLTFMRALVRLELNALGREQNSETAEIKTLRSDLANISAYLQSIGGADISLSKLPENQIHILNMLEEQTGQRPFHPMRSILTTTRNTIIHIAHDFKKHPVTFTGLLSISLGMLWFMNRRMGTAGNLYIDPEATAITNLDFDTLGNPEIPLVLDLSKIDMAMLPSCHDHLVQILGNTGADLVQKSLGTFNLFPQHCARVKTLAFDAQQNLQGGYDFINSRLALLIHDPAKDLASTVLPDSTFRDAFYNAANHTAEFIYAANTVENVVLHTIIFTSAAFGTVRLGQMEKEELRDIGHNVQDFIWRTANNTPLNYLLCCSASAYAYVSQGGLNPGMLWMGAGGLLAGQLIHNAMRRHNAPALVQETTLSVRKAIADLSDASKIIGHERAGEPLESVQSAWQKLKIPAIGLAGTAIATTIDIFATGGKVTGSVLGGLGVTVPFLAYNVPEDAALHTVFAFAGGIVGAAWLCLGKLGKKVVEWTSPGDDTSHDPK